MRTLLMGLSHFPFFLDTNTFDAGLGQGAVNAQAGAVLCGEGIGSVPCVCAPGYTDVAGSCQGKDFLTWFHFAVWIL